MIRCGSGVVLSHSRWLRVVLIRASKVVKHRFGCNLALFFIDIKEPMTTYELKSSLEVALEVNLGTLL